MLQILINILMICGIIVVSFIAIYLFILAIYIIFITINYFKKELIKEQKKQVEVDGK